MALNLVLTAFMGATKATRPSVELRNLICIFLWLGILEMYGGRTKGKRFRPGLASGSKSRLRFARTLNAESKRLFAFYIRPTRVLVYSVV